MVTDPTTFPIWCDSSPNTLIMEDDETELQNPFPSPPSHYTKYTTHNLKLLTLLRESVGDEAPNVNQHEILSDQAEVPDWQLTQLEKPRVDWILDESEPFYNVFGDTWFVRLQNPSNSFQQLTASSGER